VVHPIQACVAEGAQELDYMLANLADPKPAYADSLAKGVVDTDSS
jgi:hypothetical protein